MGKIALFQSTSKALTLSFDRHSGRNRPAKRKLKYYRSLGCIARARELGWITTGATNCRKAGIL
jgi:hypothetical protein